MNSLIRTIKNPYAIVLIILNATGFSKLLSDKLYLKLLFRRVMGKKLNLENPQTFNEKLNWLKLYDRKPKYSKMVDKYEAKKYVAELIGEEYIIPTYGVWDKFDDIDFDQLPNQFVLKCTHDSGSTIICRNKNEFDFDIAKKNLTKAIKTNYYLLGREWPYKNIKPRILAEKYLTEKNQNDLKDYKLLCFNGTVKCSFVCLDRNSDKGLKVDFYDRNWNKMPFERHYPNSKILTKCPNNYKLMIDFAEKLATNISFIRVDFYEINGNVFFGELTLYPGSGTEEFSPSNWDTILGSWINLPNRRLKKKHKNA